MPNGFKTFTSVLTVKDLQAIRSMIDSTHAPDHVLDLIERIDITIDYANGPRNWIVSERTRRKRRLVRLRQMKSANPLD